MGVKYNPDPNRPRMLAKRQTEMYDCEVCGHPMYLSDPVSELQFSDDVTWVVHQPCADAYMPKRVDHASYERYDNLVQIKKFLNQRESEAEKPR
jgi:hypothetical protein